MKALKWIPIERVWGIGRRSAKRLAQVGVNTAFEFTQLSDAIVYKQLTTVGLRLKKDLLGIPTLNLDEIQVKKNIATTRSFEKNISKKEDLQERISTFAVSCAEKLRAQKCCCNGILVFIRANRFADDYSYYGDSIFVKLPFATNSSLELVSFANQALDKIYRKGEKYKRAGVVIMDFIPEEQVQLSLFQNSNPKHISLMQTVDRLNRVFGQQKVRLAVQDQQRVWKMKQEKLSPRYTTRIDEIMKVYV